VVLNFCPYNHRIEKASLRLRPSDRQRLACRGLTVLTAFGLVEAHLFSYPDYSWALACSLPPRVGVEMKALLPLLLLFAKRAHARYRFTAGHGNTPCSRKEYYHSRLPSDIACSSARSWGATPFMVSGSL
jgi:hypothetical protein